MSSKKTPATTGENVGRGKSPGSKNTQFKSGQSGNPAGKPPGTISIKEEIRKHLLKNPEIIEQLVAYFLVKSPDLMWQMLEGRPKQNVDLDVDKDSLKELTDFLIAAAGEKSKKK